jgi:hypothetical protein
MGGVRFERRSRFICERPFDAGPVFTSIHLVWLCALQSVRASQQLQNESSAALVLQVLHSRPKSCRNLLASWSNRVSRSTRSQRNDSIWLVEAR